MGELLKTDGFNSCKTVAIAKKELILFSNFSAMVQFESKITLCCLSQEYLSAFDLEVSGCVICANVFV